MLKNVFYALIFILLFQFTYSQETSPLLKGKVNLSITQGTIECEFTLSEIPAIEDYFIRINSGMNIRYFKNVTPAYPLYYERSFYDTTSTGETSAYYFPRNNNTAKYLPASISFSYTGKFPVFYDSLKDYSAEDWKGNLSFNGYSLRADGGQSGWYPLLYDIKKDIRHEKVRYEIEVNCADCSAIYVNGSTPVSASKATFKSNVPHEIAMYAGRYKISNQGGTYILNPDMSDNQIKQFAKVTNDIKQYYTSKLSIPYGEAITYIQTTPTSENNAWLFVSYPSIFNIGREEWGMKKFFDPKNGDRYKAFFAHELGHYYFGTYRHFNSELGDMMNEGFSEYLSFRVARDLVSDSAYKKIITQKARAASSFQAIPFAKVKSRSDYRNRELYVYYYAPIIFTAIEKEIGEANMWKWLKALLETKADFTNYTFMEQTLGAIVPKEKLEIIKSKYFYSDKAIENAVQAIGLMP